MNDDRLKIKIKPPYIHNYATQSIDQQDWNGVQAMAAIDKKGKE